MRVYGNRVFIWKIPRLGNTPATLERPTRQSKTFSPYYPQTNTKGNSQYLKPENRS